MGLSSMGLSFTNESQNTKATRLSGLFLTNWSGREDLNLRPLGPKPKARQKRKYLPFQKLQPPQIT